MLTFEDSLMRLPVRIESNAAGGYTAKLGPPFDWSADGATREDARLRLQSIAVLHFEEREKAEPVMDTIEIPYQRGTWWDHVGTLPDDELTREWQRIMKENRIKQDAEDEASGKQW
jgi:predicted RNase H-like HicB family nuclease